MASQQLSISLDSELVAFLDQQVARRKGGSQASKANRSAAIAEAVRRWRDQVWQQELEQAYAGEVRERQPL